MERVREWPPPMEDADAETEWQQTLTAVLETFLGRTINHEKDRLPVLKTLDLQAARGVRFRADHIEKIAGWKLQDMEAEDQFPYSVTPLVTAIKEAADNHLREKRKRENRPKLVLGPTNAPGVLA